MGSILMVRKADRTDLPTTPIHTVTCEHGYDLRPNPQVYNHRRFRVPVTLESDWHQNLLEDKKHVNYCFELMHDWYEQFEDDYEPMWVRAQQTPIDWKSKIGNSDASFNFKTTHEAPVVKGDMVRREDGVVSILNWDIQEHANNKATQVAKCNLLLTVKRHVEEELDPATAIMLSPAHEETIVHELPVIITEYAGRPDFTEYMNIPGITPDHLSTLSMQWNSQTKNIKIGDTFDVEQFTYRIVQIAYQELNISKTAGVLLVYAKRVAGGEIDAETP